MSLNRIEAHGRRAHADHLRGTLLCRFLCAFLLIFKSDSLIQLPGDAKLLGDLTFAILFALNEKIRAVPSTGRSLCSPLDRLIFKIPCLPFAVMMAKQQEDREVLQEIKELCLIHQKITQSSECRDFNHRAALLLQSLEEKGFFPLADRIMDLLACCNPKDISQCDSVQRARDILDRLGDLARESLENNKN